MATAPRNNRRDALRLRAGDPLPVRLRFGHEVPLTDRMFRLLCRANPEMRLERSPEGELVVMSPAGSGSGSRNFKIAGRLYAWIEETGLGLAFDSSTGFTLPNGAIRSPDASWVDGDRWDALAEAEREGFAPICPDFVIELRSRTDPLRDLRRKMREYRSQGARLGWLIDPIRQVVEVYRPRRKVERLERPASLSGEEVLPGFVLDLAGILFEAGRPAGPAG